MAFLDHNGESEFPVSKNLVFDAMCIAIPTIKGLKVENADKLQGRILVKAGVSLYSWGENIPIQLLGIDENKTKVQITSSPKTGIMFGGAFDMGKNRKNIENILSATSSILQKNINQQTSQQNQTSNFQTTQVAQPVQNFSSMSSTNQTSGEPKKKMGIGKKLLIGFGVLIFLIVIANLGKDKKTDTPATSPTEQSPSTTSPSNETTTSPTVDKDQQEEDKIKEKLKAKAKRDWPNDYTTQEYWINEQIEAYKYMKTIPDGSVKSKAQHDFPLDYTTQKYWYNEQVEAKERMK